jgi:hypothetical protein
MPTGRLYDHPLDAAHERLVNWLSESSENAATGEEWLDLVRTRSAGFSEGSTGDSAMTEFSLREPIERAVRGRAEGGGIIGFIRVQRWSIRRWWRDRRLSEVRNDQGGDTVNGWLASGTKIGSRYRRSSFSC